MIIIDDDLDRLASGQTLALPQPLRSETLLHDGNQLWFATFGAAEKAAGDPVILLHGGMGSSENWCYLIPYLMAQDHHVLVIDSRGQGRSSWNGERFSYQAMAGDVLAVMDHVGMAKAALVGWSDGADTGLVLADMAPPRVARLLFFACNVDASGVKPFRNTHVIERMLANHRSQYARLSPHPARFDAVFAALQVMQAAEPDFSAQRLAGIDVPVAVVQSERDEFITTEHARYLAATLPDACLQLLPAGSHFAPLQRPHAFNRVVGDFLQRPAPFRQSAGIQ